MGDLLHLLYNEKLDCKILDSCLNLDNGIDEL